MIKQLANNPSNLVSESLSGVILSNPNISKISEVNAVVRSDINIVKDAFVSIISGGGSGHEPAHVGYVGFGMLSGAVCGNVFASPSVAAILKTIRACAGKAGVLLIVKNYTGDRLNFGMALERAKVEGIKIEMLIVHDDCALELGKGITGGRGIAGTVFVHKIAGAAASQGLKLSEVFDIAYRASKQIKSIGVALSMCSIPGSVPSERLIGSVYEIGMGIHGEPGKEQRPFPPEGSLNEIATQMICHLLESSYGEPFVPQSNLALMVNNLGGLSVLELYALTGRVIRILADKQLYVVRSYVGTFMSSINMAGASLSLIHVNPIILSYLDASTSCSSWVASPVLKPLDDSYDIAKDIIDRVPIAAESGVESYPRGTYECPHALEYITVAAHRLIDIEPRITAYDLVCGDGDCGLVLRAGAQAALSALEKLTASRDLKSGDSVPINAVELCLCLADHISGSMGGTSGALLEIMLRAMAVSLVSVGLTTLA